MITQFTCIVLVVLISAIAIIILNASSNKYELKKKEMEHAQAISELALSNESMKVDIHNIQIGYYDTGNVLRQEGLEVNNETRKAYELGFNKGFDRAKSQAIKLLNEN